eukprot:TRINITY_DN10888_c0_g1_i1.p2 TRINITY_DN10888_c0_g1~~TRINITY_DN10888_c0_g1_i1.p2  ORF type:complete len:131 (-),score=18.55 TRINITY_DN10888_c0_g1_i1:193-585(-)
MMVSDPCTTFASVSRMGADRGSEADTKSNNVALTVLLLGGAVVGGWTVRDILWRLVDGDGEVVTDVRSVIGVSGDDRVLEGAWDVVMEWVEEYGGLAVMGWDREADGERGETDFVLDNVNVVVPVCVGAV